MTEPKWLLEEFVKAVHNIVLATHGGPTGIRDVKMLESALARPLNKFGYEPTISIYELAASYSYGISMNHPFVDGNKRTALVCGLVFLEINGIEIQASEADAVVAFEALAAGKFSEDELGNWFRDHV